MAFNTVFLPILLPGRPNKGEDYSILKSFQEFLSCSGNALGNLHGLKKGGGSMRDEKGWKHMLHVAKNLVDLHGKLLTEQLHPYHIQNQLKNMDVGEYWAFWVQAQNAVILIQRNKDESVMLACWEVQLPNDKVMSGTHRFVWQQLPSRSCDGISLDQVQDRAFSELLLYLALVPQNRALPKSKKSGQDFHETRDVNSPLYVFDYLLMALGVGNAQIDFVGTIHQKYRDEVCYDGGELPWRRAGFYWVLKCSGKKPT